MFGGKSGKKVGCHKKMEGDLTELCVVVSSSPLLPSHQPRSLTQQPPEHPPNLDNHFPRKPPSEALITALPLTLSHTSCLTNVLCCGQLQAFCGHVCPERELRASKEEIRWCVKKWNKCFCHSTVSSERLNRLFEVNFCCDEI